MSSIDIISVSISLVSIIISLFTFYRTTLARFHAEIQFMTRIGFTKIDSKPVIVVGFEIANLGAKSGVVDDILLVVNQTPSEGSTADQLTFIPLYIRDSYNVNTDYETDDFEQFQSIPLAKNVRLIKYIIFAPERDNFRPCPSKLEFSYESSTLGGHPRKRGQFGRIKGLHRITIDLKEKNVNDWENGKSIMLTAKESLENRIRLIEKRLSS